MHLDPYQSFYGCVSLKSENIPPTIATFGDTSFKGCTLLTSLMIPASVTSILDQAFNGLSSLES